MMQLEQGKLSSGHLIFLIFGYTLGSSVILNPGRLAGHDAWLVILAGLGVGLLYVFIFTTLALRFKGKNLVEINDLIFGKYLGKLLSLTYLGYFLWTGSLATREFCDFFVDTIYPQTPLIVFVILILIVCAYAVRHGIEVIMRCSIILFPVVVGFFLLGTFFLVAQMEFTNFLPVFDISWQRFILSTCTTSAFPFGETVVLLMVLAYVQDQQKIRKSVILSVVLAGLFLCAVVIITTAVLGITADIQTYPSLLTIRLINAGEVFTRLEIIVLGTILAFGFLKIVVLYYAATLGLAQVFKLRSYLPLVIPVGIMTVVIAMLSFENMNELIEFDINRYRYYALPIQVGLPLLSLIVAAIRGVRGKA